MATITHKPVNFDACPVFQPPPIARTHQPYPAGEVAAIYYRQLANRPPPWRLT